MQDWTPEQLETHLGAGEKVFLKLWKRGCGPCKLSTPALERIEAADTNGMVFGQINVDDYPEMYEITGVEMVPAFFVFQNMKKTGVFTGFKGLAALQEFIKTSLTLKKVSDTVV